MPADPPPSRLAAARLYLLATASVSALPLVVGVEAAIRGGVDLVQFREKDLSDAEFTERARSLLAICRAHRVPFVINDRIDVARELGADGVHLGQDDESVDAARARLTPGTFVGVSTHDRIELERAIADGADYVGVGSVFATSTKNTHVPISGPKELAPLAALAESAGLPAFAIGGITIDRVGQVAAAGLQRIAVCSGILSSDDPEGAARDLRRALDR